MKSPVHPRIMGWAVRPQPTGRRRYAAAYLSAAAAAGTAVGVLGITVHAAGSCTTAGFACLGVFFRGIAVATVLGLAVLLAVAGFCKLGGSYLLTLAAFALPLVLIGLSLDRMGLPALPIALAALSITPALAARFSAPHAADDADPVGVGYTLPRTAILAAPAALSVCALLAIA